MNLIFQHICTQRYSNAKAGFNPSKRNKFSKKAASTIAGRMRKTERIWKLFRKIVNDG